MTKKLKKDSEEVPILSGLNLDGQCSKCKEETEQLIQQIGNIPTK